jgi:hypothetical protein
MRHLSQLILLILFAAGSVCFAQAAPNWNAAGQGLGKSGTRMPGGTYRVGLPRSDLHVQLDAIELKPTFALGSRVTFSPMGPAIFHMHFGGSSDPTNLARSIHTALGPKGSIAGGVYQVGVPRAENAMAMGMTGKIVEKPEQIAPEDLGCVFAGL